MNWKRYKKPLLVVLIAAVLAAAFFLGDPLGNRNGQDQEAVPTASEEREERSERNEGEVGSEESEGSEKPASEAETAPEQKKSEEKKPAADASADKPSAEKKPGTSDQAKSSKPSKPDRSKPASKPKQDKGGDSGGQTHHKPAPKPESKPTPKPKPEPKPTPAPEHKPGPRQPTCQFSISCATILDNMDHCKKEKQHLVPADGWLLKEISVPFKEGESVMDVLYRVCHEHKIHLEYENTPGINSAYVEGIGNLYEFDVGEDSGWMYAVNGKFPNYGCSEYTVKNGDVVAWQYTCALGWDIGGGYAADP